ncbi:hypothetical protein T265_12363, partial [Opisthorchis viverrini]
WIKLTWFRSTCTYTSNYLYQSLRQVRYCRVSTGQSISLPLQMFQKNRVMSLDFLQSFSSHRGLECG